jgi:hypothetical protein
MTGAARLSRQLNPSQHTRPTSASDRAQSAVLAAITAAAAGPRQGCKPVRVKTRQSRGFSEADNPVLAEETSALNG